MMNDKSIDKMSFEEALLNLEEIVRKIDSGADSLEIAVSSFKKGVELKNHCEKKLNAAKLEIEKIIKKEDGNIDFEKVSKESL